MTLRYWPKNGSMSTTRSLITRKPSSGATEILLPSWSTRILHARRLRPLISMASDPHTPCAHERRNVSVPSVSPLTLSSRSSTRSIGPDSTRYPSQCGFSSSSGLKRSTRRSISIDLDGSDHSVGPRFGLELGDRHRLVLESRRAKLGLVRKRVAQPVRVVAIREVLPRVAAARLLARQRRVDRGLRAVEQVAQLTRLEQIGVEDPAAIVDAYARVAILQLGQALCHLDEALARPEDAGE